jgi:hypothetical protein
MAAGSAVWAVTDAVGTFPMLLGFALLFGAGYGAWLPLGPPPVRASMSAGRSPRGSASASTCSDSSRSGIGGSGRSLLKIMIASDSEEWPLERTTGLGGRLRARARCPVSRARDRVALCSGAVPRLTTRALAGARGADSMSPPAAPADPVLECTATTEPEMNTYDPSVQDAAAHQRRSR